VRGRPGRQVVDAEDFQRRSVEKLLWATVFWLLSAARGGLPVGLVATLHRGDVEALVAELLPLTHASVAPAVVPGAWGACAPVPHPTACAGPPPTYTYPHPAAASLSLAANPRRAAASPPLSRSRPRSLTLRLRRHRGLAQRCATWRA
jgi:hypothetical protein